MLPIRPSALCPLVVLVLAASAAGCGSADQAPPVAEVSVTVDETRVPIGAPVVFTYRFTPRETVEGDYSVFVHLLNADGQTLWNDDHEPAVPTSSWRAGEVVEYTREVFLAGPLSPGDATIEVGLYREAERLALDGPRPVRDPVDRAYPVVDLQLVPESENVFLVFQAGWHPDEFAADQPSRPWKWTQRSAAIAFRHPKRDATLLLEYDGRPDVFGDTPQQLRVIAADNQEVASFPVASDQAVLRRVPLTSEQMGTADPVELRLDVDRTFNPADAGIANGDSRELGIRVFNVFLDVR